MVTSLTREQELAVFDGYCYALSALSVDAPDVLTTFSAGELPDKEWASWPHVVQYAGLGGAVSAVEAWAALSNLKTAAEGMMVQDYAEQVPGSGTGASGFGKGERAKAKGKLPTDRSGGASAGAEDLIEDPDEGEARAGGGAGPNDEVLTEQPEFHIIGKKSVGRKGRQNVEYLVSFVDYPGEDEWFCGRKVVAAATGRKAIAEFELAASERHSAWVDDQLREMEAAQPRTQEETQPEEEGEEDVAMTQPVEEGSAAAAVAAAVAAASATAQEEEVQAQQQEDEEEEPTPEQRTPVTRSRVRAVNHETPQEQQTPKIRSAAKATAAKGLRKRAQQDEGSPSRPQKAPRGGLLPLPSRSTEATAPEAATPQEEPLPVSPEVGAPAAPAEPRSAPKAAAGIAAAEETAAAAATEEAGGDGFKERFAPQQWETAQVTKMRGCKDSQLQDVRFQVEWDDGFKKDVTYSQIRDHPACAYKLLGFVLKSISFMKTKGGAKTKGGPA